MNSYYLWMGIDLVCAAFPVVTGVVAYRAMDQSLKIFLCYVACILLTEIAAYYAAFRVANNAFVYAISGMLQFALISLYFTSLLSLPKYLGLILAATGILAGLANLSFFQPPGVFPDNFVWLQGLVTVLFSLICMCVFIRKREDKGIWHIHFRICSLQVFSWLVLLVHLGLYNQLAGILTGFRWALSHSLQFVNAMCNTILALLFIIPVKEQYHAGKRYR